MRLYLASTSPARLALLRQVGIEPVVVPSHVDEEAAVRLATDSNGELDASAMVTLLARLKAEAILGQRPDGEEIDGVILGGDSAFELDGVIYGKPHEPQIARERWLEQRGKTGTLHSGHWIIEVKNGTPARALGATAHASVEFASDISDSEIDAYVASGEPLQVAGAFTVDGLAAPFIRSVTGAPSTVIGMSLPTLRTMLAELDIDMMSLRATAP
ncbi:Maf family protein [Agreia sp. PsM10]|uniref:Maf family protein n=1 Tax=Agreia sp. PsM10 TaxID=3030533 RepID=UPI00263B79BC|nr:Maf family protein [Agreia sp. PsM10]MDN4639256.1 Maf family protein [Agreia sp. PsM10]